MARSMQPAHSPSPFASAGAAAQKLTKPSHWPVLLASAVLEAVWAIALAESQGFTVLAPAIVFFVTSPLSMIGLAYAMRGIPVSVAYAVWTGTGAALTVAAAMIMGSEPVSALKLVFLAGIIGCVIGLKFAKDPASSGPAATQAPATE